jgi:hypothetical protein
MFILYTGWGYWSYELDWEQIGLEHPSAGREPDQYIQSRLFELPDFAKKEINLQSYAVTEYLLSTDDSDMDIRFPYINTPRFYVCSDPVDYDNYGQPDCKVRKITITLDKLKDSEASNVFTLINDQPSDNLPDKQRKKTRTTNLRKAIRGAIIAMEQKPSLKKLVKYFEHEDESGYILEVTDTHIIWKDTRGKEKSTTIDSVKNMLSMESYPIQAKS